jgi:hypothetical protein
LFSHNFDENVNRFTNNMLEYTQYDNIHKGNKTELKADYVPEKNGQNSKNQFNKRNMI